VAERAEVRVSRLTGLTVREVQCYRAELVDAWSRSDLTDDLVRRIRRVRRLRRDLGLDYDTLEMVLRLVERLEELESAVDRHPGFDVIEGGV
jgi:hypothetical protein